MKRRPKSKLFPYHWAAWLFTVVSRSTWIFLVGQFKFNNDVKCSCPSFHRIDRKVPWVFVTGRPWWGDVSKLGGSRSIAGVEQRVHLFLQNYILTWAAESPPAGDSVSQASPCGLSLALCSDMRNYYERLSTKMLNDYYGLPFFMLIFALISSLGLAGNWEDFYGGGHKTCLSFCSGHGGSSPSYHRVHLDWSATAQPAPKISKSSLKPQTLFFVSSSYVSLLHWLNSHLKKKRADGQRCKKMGKGKSDTMATLSIWTKSQSRQ